jgi:peptide/nickel transport system substrate-binding protein
MKATSRVRAIGFLLAVGLVASACGDDGGDTADSTSTGSTGGTGSAAATTTTQTPKPGGTITFGVYGETPGLDPVVANGSGTTGGHEMNAIFDTLMRWNPTSQKYEPALADSLTANADQTEWTLKLKPNLKFTDGTALDAEAVKFNMARHITYTSRAAGLVARVKETTVVDPQTVKFTLTSAWGGFPYVLSYTPGMIGSPTALKACGDKKPAECAFNTAPVGAGAFVIDSFKPKEFITMKKNASYYGGAPYLDGLKFVFLDTGSVKTYDALKTGTLNAAFLRNPEVIKKAPTDGIEGRTALNWLGGVILMNNGVKVKCAGGQPAPGCTGKPDGELVATTPPTADKRVRQAAAFAINPDTINQRLWNGTGFAGSEFFQKSSRFYNNTPGTAYDLAKAKALVEEVKKEGKWDGSIRIACHNGNPNWGIAVQSMLEAAGFKVTRKDDQAVSGLITDIQVKKDFDIACWGFNVYEDDPFINLNQNLQSKSAGNWIGYANPEMDKLLDQAVAAKSDADRKTAFDGIAKLWNTDVPSSIFEATGEMIAWNKNVKGIGGNVTNVATFEKAWISS